MGFFSLFFKSGTIGTKRYKGRNKKTRRNRKSKLSRKLGRRLKGG